VSVWVAVLLIAGAIVVAGLVLHLAEQAAQQRDAEVAAYFADQLVKLEREP
jgi:ABC-type transporter Mla subunit MlaD